jgi:hypothetical protein
LNLQTHLTNVYIFIVLYCIIYYCREYESSFNLYGFELVGLDLVSLFKSSFFFFFFFWGFDLMPRWLFQEQFVEMVQKSEYKSGVTH